MSVSLLVDGDQYLYKCCAAAEHTTRWDDQNHVLFSNEDEVWDTLAAALRDLEEHFGTKDVIVTLGQEPYFRHKLFPAYKPGRGRKPLCYPEVRDRLRATYRCVEFAGLEADDVMGILATKPGNQDTVIVARDKDMKSVPAKVWDGTDFANITLEQADYFHMFQTLTGDITDGYKGCPGVGPVKAAALLNVDIQGDYPSAWLDEMLREKRWRIIVATYEKAGLTADDALLNARLARILRWSDWDRKNKEPILWTPR